MLNPPQIADCLPPDATIDHAAFDRAFRAWERRRACPAELIEIDRREAAQIARARKTNGRKKG